MGEKTNKSGTITGLELNNFEMEKGGFIHGNLQILFGHQAASIFLHYPNTDTRNTGRKTLYKCYKFPAEFPGPYHGSHPRTF